MMGRANHSDFYEDVDEYKNLVPPPQIRIFRFNAPLYYANKDSFLKYLYNSVGVEPFLELTKRRKAEKKAKELSLKNAKANNDKTNGEVVVGLIQREVEFHTIVLDCSAVPFIDTAGTAAFKGLVKEYKEIGVHVLLACCNTMVIDTLQRGQFFGKNNQEMSSRLFHTVHSAVVFAHSLTGSGAKEGIDRQQES